MDDDFRKTLAGLEPHEKVSAIRKHIGLTQKEIANILDVHWITISRIERGIIRLSREWVERISFALHVNEDDIYNIPPITPTIRVHGEIGKGGSIFRGEVEDYSTDADQFVGDTFYYVVRCDDFEPLISRGDILKTVQVRKHQWNNIIRRACISRSSDGERVMGILDVVADNKFQLSEMWDNYVIRNIRREVVVEGDFDVESVVTEVIFTFIPPNDGRKPVKIFDENR